MINYDTTVFSPEEEKLINKAINLGHIEELVNVLIAVSPEKIAEIEKIQKALRPQTFTFQSEKQKEAEVYIATHLNELTPAKEAELQAEIDREKAEKLAQLSGDVTVVKSEVVAGTSTTQVIVTNNLNDVEGLGEASISKLNAINVYSVDELRKLPQEERNKILGPLVAHKIKNLT